MPPLELETQARRTFCDWTAEITLTDYVQRPAYLLRSRVLEGQPAFGAIEGKISPFEFILRMRSPGFIHYDDYEIPPPWTLFLVTGQYGMGKTAFVRILLDLTNNDLELSSRWCLIPVALSSCRSQLGPNTIPPSFEELIKAAGIEALSELESDDRRKLYILDGLDELVTNVEAYQDFFLILRDYLTEARRRGSYADIVVLTRVELILSLDSPDSRLLLGSFLSQKDETSGFDRSTVYGLALDFFDRSRVVTYLKRKLFADAELAISLIDTNSDYLETLKRPLLLKIFCDLHSQGNVPADQMGTMLSNPSILIDRYVDHATVVGRQNQEQAKFDTTWNRDRLAEMALELYKTQRVIFTKEELSRIQEPNEKADTKDLFHSISKCPFLQRMEDTAIFSHRLFLEYFIAKGMAELTKKANEDSIAGVPEFNELVLNVDMRQILRYFINGNNLGSLESTDTRFHRITQFSYGLRPVSADDWHWPERPLKEESRLRLDGIRRILLDAMTFPTQRQQKFADAIRAFFETEVIPDRKCTEAFFFQDLDPRYQMYCYESIATYLAYGRRSTAEFVDLESELVLRVVARLEGLSAAMASEQTPLKPEVRKRYQLLLQRLVLIARRLGIGRGRIKPELIKLITQLVEKPDWDEFSKIALLPSLTALGKLL